MRVVAVVQLFVLGGYLKLYMKMSFFRLFVDLTTRIRVKGELMASFALQNKEAN